MPTIASDPIVDRRRLEQLMLLVRLGGAVLVPALGPLFLNTGGVYIAVLAVTLLVWCGVLAYALPRLRTPVQQQRFSYAGFVVDMAIVIYAIWLFSPDPNWTVWTVGILVIIGTAFRFGRGATILSAALLAGSYVVIVAWREAEYGIATPLQLVAFHVTVYLLAAMLLTGTLRELHKLRDQREFQYFHDLLTGLPNRLLLIERTEQALIRAKRTGEATALLLLDLSDFKAVNDGFGHDAGDTLLTQVAPRLRTQLRQSDTVARLGGDEFAVLLPGTGAAGAEEVAQKMLTSLEHPFTIQGEALDVSASIGIAVAPDHGNEAELLLSRADAAMYAAKGTVSSYSLFDPRRDDHGASRLSVMADLRRGIDEGELLLHYQPILETSTGVIRSVEALVRWMRPEHGLVAPSEFVPLAEQTGLIKRLTRDVLSQAFRQARAWELAGLPLPIAVNLSTRTLLDPQLPEIVLQLAQRWGTSLSLIRFEITESVLAAQTDRALATIAALRATGAKIALDDFGTGYSSLAYLNRLPIDELKIDRSFVSAMLRDTPSATIVRATIDLGHSLGYTIVAEGVEDEATRGRLGELGCDLIQGFLLARPMRADDLTPWLGRPKETTVQTRLS